MTRDFKVILEGVFSLLIEEITTLIIIIVRDKKSIAEAIFKTEKDYEK